MSRHKYGMRNWIDLIVENETGPSPLLAELFAWFKEEPGLAGGSIEQPHYMTGLRWAGSGWDMTVSDIGQNRILLHHIEVSEWARGQGLGNKLMGKLLELADKHHVTILLQADESDDLVDDDEDEDDEEMGDYDEREHWLQTWYSRLGFDYTGDSGDYGPYMERQPNA